MSGFLDLKTVCPDPGPADERLALQEEPLELHHHRPFNTFHFLRTAGHYGVVALAAEPPPGPESLPISAGTPVLPLFLVKRAPHSFQI